MHEITNLDYHESCGRLNLESQTPYETSIKPTSSKDKISFDNNIEKRYIVIYVGLVILHIQHCQKIYGLKNGTICEDITSGNGFTETDISVSCLELLKC